MSISRASGFVPLKLTFPVMVAPFAASGESPGLVAGSVLVAAFSLEPPHPVIRTVLSRVEAMKVLCKLILR